MTDEMAAARERARRFLAGSESLRFDEADRLWHTLKSEPSLARPVLGREPA